MIYISGASGFVGKALRAALSGARRPYAALDLRGAAKLPRFQAEDTVVHLAAIAHAHGVSRAELRAVNVELAASVAEAAAAAGARLLFLSSVKLRAFLREQPPHALALLGQIMAERTVLLDKLRELTTLSVEQRLLGRDIEASAAF